MVVIIAFNVDYIPFKSSIMVNISSKNMLCSEYVEKFNLKISDPKIESLATFLGSTDKNENSKYKKTEILHKWQNYK